MSATTGPIALLGGGEWREGCVDIDRALLDAAGGAEVVVLPTAAAYEGADAALATATRYFEQLGATVRPLRVLRRHEAEQEEHADVVRAARFIYLGGGSPLHLRSVLKDSALWRGMVEAWQGGAVLAGSSAGAMVLCDPLLDPRGGAYTLGLGLLMQLAVMPHANQQSADRARRSIDLAPRGTRLLGIDEQTAAVRHPDGRWEAVGQGRVRVWVDGDERDLSALS